MYDYNALRWAFRNDHHNIVHKLKEADISRNKAHLIARLRYVQHHQLQVSEPYNSLARLPEHIFRIIFMYYC